MSGFQIRAKEILEESLISGNSLRFYLPTPTSLEDFVGVVAGVNEGSFCCIAKDEDSGLIRYRFEKISALAMLRWGDEVLADEVHITTDFSKDSLSSLMDLLLALKQSGETITVFAKDPLDLEEEGHVSDVDANLLTVAQEDGEELYVPLLKIDCITVGDPNS